MSISSVRFMSLSALLTMASPLAAQAYPEEAEREANTPDRQAPDTIIVTGDGLADTPSVAAYATTKIEREEILSAPSGKIEDVLGAIAGFQQFRRSDSRSANPSAQGATLRSLGGNASSRALVLLDGVPIADPFFGFIPFNALAPERLSSIRVTRGGGSGPFGTGALTGTIELESSDATTLGSFSGQALVNDRGETETSATIAQKMGNGFAVVSGRWDRGQGFFTTPKDQRVPATVRAAFDNYSFGLRAVAPLSDDIELQARGLVYDDNRTLRFDGADSSSEGQDASLRIIGRGVWQFDALGYVQARNFSNVVISSTRFVRVLDQRNTPSTGFGGKLELRPPVGQNQVLRLGVDYRRSDGELQEEAYSAFTGALSERRRAGGTNSDFGLFAEHDWRLGPITLTGGIRADLTSIKNGFFEAADADGTIVSETSGTDRSDWSVSWRSGAALAAGNQLTLRAAAYTSQRLPTLNELYRPFVVFPVVTQANADLENERLEGFEIGFDFEPTDKVRLSLTAFDNKVKDAIANVTLAANLRQRQNLPAIKAQGVEANTTIEIGSWRLAGSLSYTDAMISGSGSSIGLDGNRPPQTPQWAGSATLGWQPFDGWDLALSLRHMGSQFEDDQEADVLPSATTLSFYGQVPLSDNLSLLVRAENLTDEAIVTRNTDGAIDLGIPRTIWVGFRYGI
jgi:outer membrane receptor protein involved in Fe transport